jgi:hypothetical protein
MFFNLSFFSLSLTALSEIQFDWITQHSLLSYFCAFFSLIIFVLYLIVLIVFGLLVKKRKVLRIATLITSQMNGMRMGKLTFWSVSFV